jgi:hypothetical protein
VLVEADATAEDDGVGGGDADASGVLVGESVKAAVTDALAASEGDAEVDGDAERAPDGVDDAEPRAE